MASHILPNKLLMLIVVWVACQAPLVQAASISTTGPDEDLNQEVTYTIQNSDEGKVKLVSTIVSALEDLGVLGSNHQNCYSLDKVTKSMQQESEKTWKVGIYLYVREMINGKGRPGDGGHGDPKAHTLEGQNEECLVKPSLVVGPNVGTIEPPAESQGEEDLNSTGQDTGSNMGSSANLTASETSSVQDDEDKETGGLSRTQIMVISTCSTVIGVFFIVALIMRIRYHLVRENNVLGHHFRNYVKRVKEEQATRRMNYRSSSIAMRGSFDGRRDSNSNSKVGSMAKQTGPTSQLINTDSSPNHSSPLAANRKNRSESKPLLVVTEASVPSSPVSDRLSPIDNLILYKKVAVMSGQITSASKAINMVNHYPRGNVTKSSSGESFLGQDADPAIFFDSNHRAHLHPAIIYDSNLYNKQTNSRRHSDSNSNRSGAASKCDSVDQDRAPRKRKVVSESDLQNRDPAVNGEPVCLLSQTDLHAENSVKKETTEEPVPDKVLVAGLTQSDSSIGARPSYQYVQDGHQREYRPPAVKGHVTALTYPQYSNHKTSESDFLIDIENELCSSDANFAQFVIGSDESAENSPSWIDHTEDGRTLPLSIDTSTTCNAIIPEYDENLNKDSIKIDKSDGLPNNAINHYNDIFGDLISREGPQRPSLKLPKTTIPNQDRKRKSVTFSVEEEEIVVDMLSSDSEEELENLEDPFLLGSNFEGMKPTYV